MHSSIALEIRQTGSGSYRMDDVAARQRSNSGNATPRPSPAPTPAC